MRRFAVVLLLLTQTACATAVNGRYQRVAVDSNPSGARVELDHCGRRAPASVTTPAVVQVSRRATRCTLTFSLDPGAPQVVTLKRRFTPAIYLRGLEDWCGEDLHNCNSTDDVFVTFLGSVLFLPSFLLDAASGALFEQAPAEVAVTLDE